MANELFLNAKKGCRAFNFLLCIWPGGVKAGSVDGERKKKGRQERAYSTFSRTNLPFIGGRTNELENSLRKEDRDLSSQVGWRRRKKEEGGGRRWNAELYSLVFACFAVARKRGRGTEWGQANPSQ